MSPYTWSELTGKLTSAPRLERNTEWEVAIWAGIGAPWLDGLGEGALEDWQKAGRLNWVNEMLRQRKAAEVRRDCFIDLALGTGRQVTSAVTLFYWTYALLRQKTHWREIILQPDGVGSGRRADLAALASFHSNLRET
jgi:hypothetical protein